MQKEEIQPWIAPNAQEEIRKLMRGLHAEEMAHQEPLGSQVRRSNITEIINLSTPVDERETRVVQLGHCEDLAKKGASVDEAIKASACVILPFVIEVHKGLETLTKFSPFGINFTTNPTKVELYYREWDEEEQMYVAKLCPLDLDLRINKSVKYILNMDYVYKVPFGLDMKPALKS